MKKILPLCVTVVLLTAPAISQADDVTPGFTLNLKGIGVSLGGFLDASSIYRTRNLNSDLSTPFQKIPLPNSAGYYQDETRFSARQSRLFVLVKGDVNPATHLAGYYEMDFLGAATTSNSNESNSFTPRVRHAYATVDWDTWGLHLLAGQTWSLVTVNGGGITPRKEVIPLTIDAQYVPGYTWARQAQFRIVKDWDKTFWLALSVENAQTTSFGSGTNYSINQSPGGNFSTPLSSNDYPDLVVKLAFEPEWGHFEIYNLFRTFQSTTATGTVVHNSHRTADSVGGAASVPLFSKRLTVQVSGTYGKGIGRYGTSQLPDVTLDPGGNVVPIEGSRFLGGVIFSPTKAWDFYAYYGQEEMHKTSWTEGTDYFGYGNENYDNTGWATFNGTVKGNIKRVSQWTGGAWWKFYDGSYGKMQLGVQYSYTDNKYFAAKGGGPNAYDQMAYTSLRYYWQ